MAIFKMKKKLKKHEYKIYFFQKKLYNFRIVCDIKKINNNKSLKITWNFLKNL